MLFYKEKLVDPWHKLLLKEAYCQDGYQMKSITLYKHLLFLFNRMSLMDNIFQDISNS